jgi:hypothetical protein
VRWTGRLPADLLATVPMDQECWWLALAGEGAAFNCHPLPTAPGGGGGGGSGDVAWQALATAGALAARGLAFDPSLGRVRAAAGDGDGAPPGGGSGRGGKLGSGRAPSPRPRALMVEEPLLMGPQGAALMSPRGAAGGAAPPPAGHDPDAGDAAAAAALAATPWVSGHPARAPVWTAGWVRLSSSRGRCPFAPRAAHTRSTRRRAPGNPPL